MISKKVIAAAAAIVGLVGAGAAHAYSVAYGHSPNGSRTAPAGDLELALEARDAFYGGGTPQIQDFEGIAAGSYASLVIPFGDVVGDVDTRVNATLTSAGGLVDELPAGLASREGRYSVGDVAAGGRKFWEARATASGTTFELSFDNPVVKFGFFGVDVGDFGGILQLELLNAAGNWVPVAPNPLLTVRGGLAEGSVLYFGITAENEDEWFTRVLFRSSVPAGVTSVADVFAFDSFTVVAAPRDTSPTPVPTPGTLALLGAALTGLALMRRRA